MKIKELLESLHFDDGKYVKNTNDGREIDYDLVDDVVHFMYNNDDFYRRYLYPVVAKCTHRLEDSKECGSEVFKYSVEQGYDEYIKKYPIRELPDTLDSETCQQICDQLLNDIKEDMQGKTNDRLI